MTETTEIKTPAELGDDVTLLFDGVCNLCNGWVDFVLARETNPAVCFASLQSEVGKGLLTSRGMPEDYLGSLVLIEGDQTFTNSAAILRMAKYLGWPWRWLGALLIFPAFLRDPVYCFIAKRRYMWFGKQDTCRMPTPELRERFLDG